MSPHAYIYLSFKSGYIYIVHLLIFAVVEYTNIKYLGLFSNIRPVVDNTGAAHFDLVFDTLGNDALFSIGIVR